MSGHGVPPTIYIPPLTYKVEVCDPGRGISESQEGVTEFLPCIIRLNSRCAPDRLRSVLWHEVLHAVWEAADLPHGWKLPGLGITFSDLDETIVEALTGRTLEVLRVNRGLRRFLFRA